MIFSEEQIFRHSVKERNLNMESQYAEEFRRKLQDFYHFHIENLATDEPEKVLRFVAQYQMCRERKGPRPDKGLFMNGLPGRGKTFLASILSMELKIQFYSMRQIDEKWGTSPEECQYDYKEAFDWQSSIIIDDVGAESGTKRYGNEPILQSLIYRLYENWRWHGKIIIMTSNLSTYDRDPGDQRTIVGCLGGRIDSRFAEMFDTVRFVGKKDYRKE